MNARSGRAALAVLACAGLLAACASADGLLPGSRPADPAALVARDSLAAMPAQPGAWPASDWWKTYGDPQLDALIAQSLAGSPTLAVARARMEQADAHVAAADAASRSTLGVAAGMDRQRYTENGIYPPPIAGATLSSGQLAAGFSHDFDFWGRQRAVLEAALSRARAAAIEGEAAKLSLAAAVVRAYVELDHQYALLEVAEDLLKQREQVRALTESRVGAGLETRVELRQSSSSVFAARTDVAAARERIALMKDELAALAGQGPDRGLAIARPRLGERPSATLPASLPADLLGRRPDILAQRLRVEAAGGDIAAARAGFYPNVDLTAFLGVQSVGLGQLLQGGSRILGAGTAFSLPIFDGGRLRANLAARNADQNLAVEQYNATLVQALREVADQVNGWHWLDVQSGEQRHAQAEAEEAYRLALLRYREGLSSYLTVLSVESQVLAQRRLAADLRARRLAATVGLVRALGGGFQGEPARPSNIDPYRISGVPR
ncbi:MAG: efflux transporter outer membrane subunit [Rhodocyclaceae bacterium]|nr:efflux transporter outer membrane subunit [Rhodocyclaceae bacterium]